MKQHGITIHVDLPTDITIEQLNKKDIFLAEEVLKKILNGKKAISIWRDANKDDYDCLDL